MADHIEQLHRGTDKIFPVTTPAAVRYPDGSSVEGKLGGIGKLSDLQTKVKTSLVAAINEVLLSGGSDKADKSYVDEELAKKQALIESLQAAIDAITGAEDTTAAIDTMNEIIAFLNSFKDTDNLASILSTLESTIKQWVQGQNYLTEHQDISGKTDKAYVDEELKKKADASKLEALSDKVGDIPEGENVAEKISKLEGRGISFTITENDYDVEYDDTKGVAPYSTSYGYTNVTIKADSGVKWVEGATYIFVIDTKVATSTNRNVRVRIGVDGDWKPIMVTSAIASGYSVFVKAVNSIFIYKTVYQGGGALHTLYDTNSTYTVNYLYMPGRQKAGVGTYAITRYALCMQKPDLTWEKIVDPTKTYTTATTKTKNPSKFLLNKIAYYITTTVVANGGLLAVNTLALQYASIDARYSTNCGATTTWNEGDAIYLVGTVDDDGLFELADTWWTTSLPTTKDGKLYIMIGNVLTASSYSITLLSQRPMLYHDGISLREYKPYLTKLPDNLAYLTPDQGVAPDVEEGWSERLHRVESRLNEIETMIVSTLNTPV